MRQIILTPDGGDSYVINDAAPAAMNVTTTPTSGGGNLREIWYDTTTSVTRDQESCATWTDQSNMLDQQGAALRIHTNSTGVTRAITVTKNVMYGAIWIFNAHVWSGSHYTQFGSVNLAATLDPSGDPSKPLPLPWSMCAKVTSAKLSLIVWPSTVSKPAYGTPGYGRSWTLPTGWVYQGQPGYYVGHLQPRDHSDYVVASTTG